MLSFKKINFGRETLKNYGCSAIQLTYSGTQAHMKAAFVGIHMGYYASPIVFNGGHNLSIRIEVKAGYAIF